MCVCVCVLTVLGVTAYAVHPGVVNTDLMRHTKRPLQLMFKKFSYFLKTPAEGAYTTLYCIVTPDSELTSGGYYRSVTFHLSSLTLNTNMYST